MGDIHLKGGGGGDPSSPLFLSSISLFHPSFTHWCRFSVLSAKQKLDAIQLFSMI